MSDESIIDGILAREGSAYTNNPADRGGDTKFGVTQRAWEDYIARDPAHAPCAHVSMLTESMARDFYRVMYLAPLRWVVDPLLYELLVDSAVQHGVARAVRWVQSAAHVDTDGVVGPDTRAAVNQYALEWRRKLYCSVLATRVKFYVDLAINDPTQLQFLRGWINRACEFFR